MIFSVFLCGIQPQSWGEIGWVQSLFCTWIINEFVDTSSRILWRKWFWTWAGALHDFMDVKQHLFVVSMREYLHTWHVYWVYTWHWQKRLKYTTAFLMMSRLLYRQHTYLCWKTSNFTRSYFLQPKFAILLNLGCSLKLRW